MVKSLLNRIAARAGAAGQALRRKLWLDRRGGVAVIVSFMAVPLTFAVGMGVDYTLAGRRHDQINGLADAAVLAGLTPSMITQSAATSQAAAQSMFTTQLATMHDITYSASNISVTAVDTPSATGTTRKVTISYLAASPNAFGTLLGMSSITLSGTASASKAQAPNIDYYMLLDTSPSMAIAATTAGIATMVSNTSSQGGCAFGCHEVDPSSDNLGNPKNITCSGQTTKSFPNGGEDNFALARCLGVTLRIDLVNQATQNMLSSAQTTEAANNTTYRFALYTFDYYFNNIQTLTSSVSTAESSAANLAQLEVYNNSGYLTSTFNNSDEDTNWDQAMSGINTAMPTPGQGTNNTGDTPQEVLFIVSDGVIDENSSGSRLISAINEYSSWCSTIKARGIRIAFLYTTYYPLTTNSFYNSYVKPFQANIGPTYAEGCASPGLYYQVSTNGDISSAMTALFQKTVTTAHLTQ